MPEYAEEQTEPTNGNPQHNSQHNLQPEQQPPQPIEVQPDGTWILGRGADRWIPSENQIGDLRWLVERDLRQELGVPPTWAENEEKIEFHKRQLALLDLAKQAPRCEHVFSDGRCCKAPRVKKGKLCYAHTLMEEKRPQEWNLPPLEDANAVMLWLMDGLRGLLEGRISERTAGLMFYGLQLAMVNAKATTFRDIDPAEMVRNAPKLGIGTKPQRTRRSTKEEVTGVFTAKGAENAKEDFTAEVAENAEEGQRDPATATSDRRDHSASMTGETRALPLRTQRNTEEEITPTFTAKGAEVAKEGQRDPATATTSNHRDHSASTTGETRALPQRAQRSTEEEITPTFTAKGAEVAKEGQVEQATAARDGRDDATSPTSEAKGLPLRAQRNTEEDFTAEIAEDAEEKAAEDFTAEIAKNAEKEGQRDFTAENAEAAEVESREKGMASRIEAQMEPQNAEVNPGVESAKSIFFGVEVGEGVADNPLAMPPSEPPRKGGQKELLMVPEEMKHYAGR